MNVCHACQRELDQASLAARRCQHCGAVVRVLAKRTIEAKPTRIGNGGGRDDSGNLVSGEPSLAGGRQSDPERKSPTLPDRSDMTIDFTASIPDGAGGEGASDSGEKLTRRSTHTLERDITVDFDESLPGAAHIDSQWRGTFDHSAKQGQTIRQRETITGHRSSLPVKSRYVRERRKEGDKPPATLAEVPDYELLDIIGEGGMGVVYAAHQSSIARTVAVKMLKPSATIREEQRDKFISEAVVTGELDHPNIVPIYDLGANDAGALFYSMKRVRGTPWDKVLHEKQVDENLGILLRVADAVAFAHAGGVIHRDLKPENVMLGDYGEVLVMDWGLARITPDFANASAVYQADNLGGTPAYMAPEMASGPVEKINTTSDVYLLGAILYEIIGGKPPHSGRDVMQCLMAASQNRIDPVRYDGELKNIALKAMATEQRDRYQSVKEFQEAIRLYQAHSESLVLTAHANQNLQKARDTRDYALFARALYGFQEALTLWKDNERARTLLAETQRDYGRCAYEKGDYDLGASLLDTSDPQQRELLAEIDVARAERDARQRRLRRAKQAVVGLVAAVIVIITVFSFWLNAQRNRAVAAEKDAVQQRNVAQKQEQLATASAKEAVYQKGVADDQRKQAEVARTDAEVQRDNAKAQREVAVEQRGIAERAKELEEYEAYVAGIGLAAAKINDNAFDFAAELLRQAVPTEPGQRDLRNWEWGRLKHLTQLSTAVFPAAGLVDAVAFSPDGKSIASGDRSGKLTVRDIASGTVWFELPHGQYVHCVAYSPDGRLLASGSSDGTIKILDAASGRLVATLGGENGHRDGVIGVRFSPDGRHLVSGSFDNTAIIWDLATSQPTEILRGHNWWVWSAEFSPDGAWIVTAGQDGKAIVWGTQAAIRQRLEALGQQVPATTAPASQTIFDQYTEFNGHTGAVYAASFSPDGRMIATGGYDKFVMVWDPDKVKPIDLARQLEGKANRSPENYRRLAGHLQPVWSVVFSPSGRVIASGSEDNAIRLWDVATGESEKILRGHGSAVHKAVFSPDGEWIASGAHDETVRLWNIAGYQEVRVLHTTVFRGHADGILSARFSSDGKQIITASRDRSAMLWNAATGERVRSFEEGHEFLATSAAFFPDGRRVATGAGDNSVRIWDITEGTQLKVISPTGRVGAVAVSPGGDWLASGSPGNELQIWDANSGALSASLSGHAAEVSAIAISSEGDHIASGDERGRVRIWRRAAPGQPWELARELSGHTRSISALRFSPDGRRLITASGDRTCGQWDVATGQEFRQLVLRHPDWVSSLDLSPDGTHALTTCDDGKARLWRLADAQQVDVLASPGGAFNSVGYSPDGTKAVLTSSVDRTVRIWNLRGQRSVVSGQNAAAGTQAMAQLQPVADVRPQTSDSSLEPLLDFNRLGGLIWSTMFAPNGNQVLTLGGNDVQLWNIDSREAVVRLTPHGVVAASDVSPDGRWVVTGSWDRSAKLWDAATGLAIRKFEGGHTRPINTVEFSRDGRELLTASDDETARLWNVETGQPTDVVFRGHTGRVLSATYSPDGARVLTTGSDKTARLWDRNSGQLQLTLGGPDGHAWAVLCGQFSPDGALVITGSEDRTARIWDTRSGNLIRVLDGHTAPVGAVAFSPDASGSRLLTGSRDNSARLWDTITGKEILSLPGHTQEVTAVRFSPDGRNVLTASRDGTAIIWLAEDWRTK
jgi:WD40 repeat protein/serine/threonine protein kinase